MTEKVLRPAPPVPSGIFLSSVAPIENLHTQRGKHTPSSDPPMIQPSLSRALALLLLIAGLLTPLWEADAGTGIDPNREFRGVWVAAVANIDWPSSRTLSTARQQAELIAIFDRARAMNLNAVLFQVRPMGDALYDSRYEPWSEFLSGTMGRPPDPYYDPLAFAIEQARKRGLELHAWINPYRASHPDAKSPLAPNHIRNTHPGIVRKYGDYFWMDPTSETSKSHTLKVVLDIVRRYDVDGIHYDDYFYPYPSYANGADFPDDANWAKYQRTGGRLSRNDWRRAHVNDFVKRLYDAVKHENPKVKVGVSPFGIWRPGFPEGIDGLDQYDKLYADAKLWLNRGWIDYFSPQLYWPIDQKAQAYRPLLAWWVGENPMKRHVWPGNFTSKITNDPDSWDPREIVNQIRATRVQAGATGNIHFSMVALMENRRNISNLLRSTVYSEPALAPAFPWLGNEAPARPRVAPLQTLQNGDLLLRWSSPPNEDLRLWAVYTRTATGDWEMRVVPAYKTHQSSVRLSAKENVTAVAISAVNRLGLESNRSLLRIAR